MADDDSNVPGMLCHLLAIFTSFLGPLIVWLIKKGDSDHVDGNGRSSLNFQFTLLIAYLALLILALGLGIILPLIFIVVVFLWFAVAVAALVFMASGSMKSFKGEVYTYPVAIPFLK